MSVILINEFNKIAWFQLSCHISLGFAINFQIIKLLLIVLLQPPAVLSYEEVFQEYD